MTGEKQEIREMAQIMCNDDNCPNCGENGIICIDIAYAEQLYEAGYRNAKTFFNDLTETIKDMPILDVHEKAFLLGVVMGMRIKYGVEIKE